MKAFGDVKHTIQRAIIGFSRFFGVCFGGVRGRFRGVRGPSKPGGEGSPGEPVGNQIETTITIDIRTRASLHVPGRSGNYNFTIEI